MGNIQKDWNLVSIAFLVELIRLGEQIVSEKHCIQVLGARIAHFSIACGLVVSCSCDLCLLVLREDKLN